MKLKEFGKNLFNSIRKKILMVFLVTTLLTSIASLLILGSSIRFISRIESMFTESINFGEFIDSLEAVDNNVSGYLTSEDSDVLMNYYISKDRLVDLSESFGGTEPAGTELDDLLRMDILNLQKSYLKTAQEAVDAKQNKDADIYIAKYVEASRIIRYIKSYIDEMNLARFSDNTGQFINLSANINNLVTANIILIIAVVVLNIFIVFSIAYSMTRPIIKLAEAAEEISNGNFDADDVIVSSNENELKVMATTFNTMKHSIREHIEDLHDMAVTESRLMDEQMRNLQMKSLLDNAELKSLQSQINPHFLFNTLNAGVQLAIIEEADRTAAFMEDVAKIFRYNVQSLNRVVTLNEELLILRSYGNMFEVRYGDRINIVYDIDEDCLGAKVPPLIIQPLVENAAIHGLGEKEDGGTITISMKTKEDLVHISVTDNGIGMSDDIINRILDEDIVTGNSNRKIGHTTGIGTQNVIHRLRLFFKRDDVIKIESIPGKMTKITLILPYIDSNTGVKDV
ncbi:MAG: histidine kinase [Clostridia bacterium]|nr:histidine kinase [Clostridia bacterium]MBN2883302.1 histidine kinase [Clostridia bacterium]